MGRITKKFEKHWFRAPQTAFALFLQTSGLTEFRYEPSDNLANIKQ